MINMCKKVGNEPNGIEKSGAFVNVDGQWTQQWNEP